SGSNRGHLGFGFGRNTMNKSFQVAALALFFGACSTSKNVGAAGSGAMSPSGGRGGGASPTTGNAGQAAQTSGNGTGGEGKTMTSMSTGGAKANAGTGASGSGGTT